jgi:signal transduction histidine kinase
MPVRVNWTIAGATAAALVVLFAFQQWLGQSAVRRDIELATAIGLQTITWGVWLVLLPLIVRTASRHPLEGRLTLPWILGAVLVGLGFVLAHTTIAAAARWAFGFAVSSDFGTVFVNSVYSGFAANALRYGAILAVYQAIVYHAAVRERDQRAAQLEVDLARAKLAHVEACLRPHFLFNTLNAITALVREDPKLAEKSIGDLSDLLRASLAADAAREVRFDEEIAFTRKYLDLERVRFQERLQVRIEASDEARRALVPHLLLQPLVENAVRHGLAPLESGGTVAVTAARQNDHLRVTVTDDGVGVSEMNPREYRGIGLRGLRARLTQLYGDRHRLDMRRAGARGTIVDIELPYRAAAS